MPDSCPLHTLLTDFLPAAHADLIEKEAVKVEALPVVRGQARNPGGQRLRGFQSVEELASLEVPFRHPLSAEVRELLIVAPLVEVRAVK